MSCENFTVTRKRAGKAIHCVKSADEIRTERNPFFFLKGRGKNRENKSCSKEVTFCQYWVLPPLPTIAVPARVSTSVLQRNI
jgi:hypothetical protein